jgi:hypothetical protein
MLNEQSIQDKKHRDPLNPKIHIDDIDQIVNMALVVESGVNLVKLYLYVDFDTFKTVVNLANKNIALQNELCILLVRAVVTNDYALASYLIKDLDVSPVCVPKYNSEEDKIKNEEL